MPSLEYFSFVLQSEIQIKCSYELYSLSVFLLSALVLVALKVSAHSLKLVMFSELRVASGIVQASLICKYSIAIVLQGRISLHETLQDITAGYHCRIEDIPTRYDCRISLKDRGYHSRI